MVRGQRARSCGGGPRTRSSRRRRRRRSASAGPTNPSARWSLEGYPMPSAEKATIVVNVNPFQEFPSLRRRPAQTKGPTTLQDVDTTALQAPDVPQADLGHPDVEADDDVLSYFCWSLTLPFFILSLINSLVLIAIIVSLGVQPWGLRDVMLMDPDGIRLLGDLSIEKGSLSVGQGRVSSYRDEDLLVSFKQGLQVYRAHKDEEGLPGEADVIKTASIGPDEILFYQVKSLKAAESGLVYFDTLGPEIKVNTLGMPPEAKGTFGDVVLTSLEVEANRIVSPIDSDLKVLSNGDMDVVGAEGLGLESKDLTVEALHNLVLEAGSAIYLEARRINLFMQSPSFPHGRHPGAPSMGPGSPRHRFAEPAGPQQLCICHPSGKLFTIPARTGVTCAKALDRHQCIES